MRIAVTGGSGQIGTAVCGQLLEAGHEVLCVDIAVPTFDCEHVEVDLCELEAARKSLAGVDQIVHLAAIPNPYGDLPEKVMGVNMMSAFNVFEAARLNGTPRVIYGCSESSSGFGIHNVVLKPVYVPIDEEHSLWPHETYSLSKHFGERIGANYAQAYGMEVVALRYAWVWMNKSDEVAVNIVARGRAGKIGGETWLGSYISRRDVAAACLCAIAYEFPPGSAPPFEAFYLMAADTFYPIPTLDLLQRLYGSWRALPVLL